jgi:23S rRNA pseudouridine2605 synthase
MTEQDKPKRGKQKPANPSPDTQEAATESGRIAKILARAGVASRRDVERMVAEGRIKVNGKTLDSPAVVVSLSDRIEVDGEEIAGIERTRLWVYHKPAGLVTTNKDPEGRKTVFETLPRHLPRVLRSAGLISIPKACCCSPMMAGWRGPWNCPRPAGCGATGFAPMATSIRRLDELKDGIAVDGVLYGAIEATLDRKQGHNVWITMGLREGKNREIKNVLAPSASTSTA